jgi:hypothetical protein
MNLRLLTPVVAAGLLCTSAVLWGQDARERHVLVSISGRNDAPTTGLTADAFDVREDGKTVEVARVAAAPPPTHLALVFDDSGALGSLSVIQPLRESLKNIVTTVSKTMPQTQIALVGAGDPPIMRTPFTGDLAKFGPTIDQFSPRAQAGGSLMEAINMTLSDLQQRKAVRPVVLVFVAEDSAETARVKPNVIEAALKSSGASLWTLVYESQKRGDDMEVTQAMGDRSAVVSDIAKRSGGVERRMNSTQMIPTTFDRVMTLITSRYQVTYLRPAGATAAPRNFEVRSRKGGTVAAPRWAPQ